MKLSSALTRTAMLCAFLLPSTTVASPDWTCIEPALRDELELKFKFQDDFAELVSTERPEFGELVQLGAEATKTNFAMRLSRIVWLWEHDPSRLASPNDFWVLDWRDDDMSQWLEADPANAVSQAQFEALQGSINEHPDLPDFRAYVSDNRSVSPYLELYTLFGEDTQVAREIVASCY